jgi:endonuclease/exonuclease/phosphatase family metal-dependent hydrolase
MRFKSLFLKLENFIFYINIFFAALLLCSYLSAVISPQKFWPLAFLGLIYPILLVINLFFCIYWAIRLKKYFFISAISILAGFNILLNSVGFNISSNADSGSSVPRLKLMAYNVHNFLTLDTPRNLSANEAILKLIKQNQPDVVGFEEYYKSHFRFKFGDSLQKVLNTNQYYFEPFLKTDYDSTGVALFSKYPIIHRGVVGISNEIPENQAIYIDMQYKSHIIRVYDFHLQSLKLNADDYFLLSHFYHHGAMNLAGYKKIFSKLKEAFIIRGEQVDIIRQHAAKCPYPYIFMGDFNDTPSSYAFNQMAIGMKNAFREKGTGIAKTFNGGFASFQIDFILLSRQFHVLNYQIVHKKISDHFPVCSEVGLN